MSSGPSSGFCSEMDGEDAGKESYLGGIGYRAGVGEIGLLSFEPLLGLVVQRSVTTPQASCTGINTADVYKLSRRSRGCCWF